MEKKEKKKEEKEEEEKEPNFEFDFLTHYLKSNLESLDAMFVSLDTNRMSIVCLRRTIFSYIIHIMKT